jgi:hypothetical protein
MTFDPAAFDPAAFDAVAPLPVTPVTGGQRAASVRAIPSARAGTLRPQATVTAPRPR